MAGQSCLVVRTKGGSTSKLTPTRAGEHDSPLEGARNEPHLLTRPLDCSASLAGGGDLRSTRDLREFGLAFGLLPMMGTSLCSLGGFTLGAPAPLGSGLSALGEEWVAQEVPDELFEGCEAPDSEE